ncbi:MAG: SpaA isopeptide-forming pilin-related protein, partial [bacterium]|nr:SpaA isopeptide-forming pilin-related protein [bacterium]
DLVSPPDGTETSTTPALDWSDAIDPDPDDTVTYTLWIDDSADFSSPVATRTTGKVSAYAVVKDDNLQNHTIYYWKVKAEDNHGGVIWSNQLNWRFRTPILSRTRFTDINGNDVGTYTIKDTVYIETTDHDQNLNPSQQETVTIVVADTGTNDEETVILTETDMNTGVFFGSLPCSAEQGSKGDGVIYTLLHHTIQVKYTDPNDANDISNDTAMMTTKLTLVAEPRIIVGNGSDTSRLTATIPGAPNGSQIYFVTEEGIFPNGAKTITLPTIRGVATTVLTASLISTNPLTVTTTASATIGDYSDSEQINILFTPGVVEGQVINHTTDQPVGGAVVKVTDMEGKIIGTRTTGSDGKYCIPIPKTGSYLTYITLPNQQTSLGEQSVNVVNLNIPTNPVNLIQGTVKKKDTQAGPTPIPDVTLSLLQETGQVVQDIQGNPVEITTDDKGNFVASNLPVGTFTLAVTKVPAGYYAYDPKFPEYGRVTVNIKKHGTTIINIEELIDPYGYVYDAQSLEHLTGVKVDLWRFKENSWQFYSPMPDYLNQPQPNPDTTDVDGNYSFMVPSGSYQLRIDSGSYTSTSGISNLYLAYQSGTITVGTQVVNFNIPLTPGAPQLRAIKTVSDNNGTQLQPGDALTYSIKVTHYGGVNATGVVIKDNIPEYTSYIPGSIKLNNEPVTANVYTQGLLTVPIGTITSGGSCTITFQVGVDVLTPDGTIITNQASIECEELSPLLTDGNDGMPDIQKTSITVVAPEFPLVLTKKNNKINGVIGEIISYEITLKRANGIVGSITDVYIHDTIPSGFKYLKGTTFIDGKKAQDPDGSNCLIFDIGTINTQVVCKYQLIIGAGVIEGAYDNVAIAKTVVAGTGSMSPALNGSQIRWQTISNIDVARVNIILSPLFDSGLIIGKVFFDENKNALLDTGEDGICGVMVVLDNGQYAITDEYGKYHIPDVKADTRVIKVNRKTLPSGSMFTTEDVYFVEITPGLLAKVNFGINYPEQVTIKIGGQVEEVVEQPDVDEVTKGEVVNQSDVEETTKDEKTVPVVIEKGIEEEKEVIYQRVTAAFEHKPSQVSVLGNIISWQAYINQTRVALPEVEVTLESGSTIDIRDKELIGKAIFIPEITCKNEIAAWWFFITDSDNKDIKTLYGYGTPSGRINWDGMDNGELVLIPGKIYYYQLFIRDINGNEAWSSKHVFGVSRQRKIDLRLYDVLFNTNKYFLRQTV